VLALEGPGCHRGLVLRWVVQAWCGLQAEGHWRASRQWHPTFGNGSPVPPAAKLTFGTTRRLQRMAVSEIQPPRLASRRLLLGRPFAIGAYSFVIIILIVLVTVGAYFALAPSKTQVSGTSVSLLITALPNLKPLDIVSCEYAAEKWEDLGFVPSPANRNFVLYGYAVLSDAAATSVRSDYHWTKVARNSLPGRLQSLLPDGRDIIVCKEINDSFFENGGDGLVHGVVAMFEDSKEHRLYFVAQDADHLIK